MLDLFGILFSSVIMFLVVLRAIEMDRARPWFRPRETGVDRSGLTLRPNTLTDDRKARRYRYDARRVTRSRRPNPFHYT